MQVTGPGGERVDTGDARVSPDDARVVEVGLEDLAEGTYTVEYRVTSVDGHVISDSYEFAVIAPEEETTQAAARVETTKEATSQEAREEPSMEPTRESLPATENAGGESSPFGTYAVVGLLILGVAALTVAGLRSRGRS